jgi:hypothetical protein
MGNNCQKLIILARLVLRGVASAYCPFVSVTYRRFAEAFEVALEVALMPLLFHILN